MFDIQLRSLKDALFDPCCRFIPSFISPLHITIAAFLSGLLSCVFATQQWIALSLAFWVLNRALDCLDGALARYRKTASNLGGFLDLLGDFTIYSLTPIAVAHGNVSSSATWKAVAVLESTFHVNNFILFYVAAVAEKMRAKSTEASKELTSVIMRPALIEGVESAIMFTLFLAFPSRISTWSWTMASLVSVGILQRTFWVIDALASLPHSNTAIE